MTRVTRCLVLLAALWTWASPIEAASAQKDAAQKKVLVIYSTRRDTRLPTIGDRLLPRLLEDGLKQQPDFYSEYIDAARFPDPSYRRAFDSYLKLKYGATKFDVVIAAHSLALDFLAMHRLDQFPETPLVYFTEDPSTDRPSNAAGVILVPDYRGTVALARQLQPDLTHLFVVIGSGARDAVTERAARKQFESLKTNLIFTYSSGMTSEEIEFFAATLPPRSAIYYLLMYQDSASVNVNPLDYLDRLSAIANRPTYSWVDSTMDHGIVGGSLMSQESEIGAAAALALRVLAGERADAIPMTSANLSTLQVDWRQLGRWGINEARLPANATIRFRDASTFERYGPFIVGAIGLLLAQSALIGGLLAQGMKRRRAEERARASQAELQASYDRIRDLGQRLLVAQDDERARIARELHDDVGQQLTLLSLDLQRLSDLEQGTENDRERLSSNAVGRADAVVRSVHDISHRLHPQKLRLLGLVAALATIRRELPSTDVNVSFTHENVPDSVPHDLTLCLYRIAQEAMQNTVKHSRAREVAMRITGDAHELALTIVDDGVGFDMDAVRDSGLGLISMQERLEPFGGVLTIRSAPGAGTYVKAVVPLPIPEPALDPSSVRQPA
jgi:signal transduction histidine kinase